ncbi:MAG: magnesium/cobalt transporter CorA [Gammaproteobacteria bacterium]|nr:magnesium/cobalt transporter CorA [Gammaproteobacteria bacterium]
MEYFEKTYHPPGTAPGTLISHDQAKAGVARIHLIDYTSDHFEEKLLEVPAQCHPYLESNTVTWIHLQGAVHADTIRNIGNVFELHPLAMEDVLNSGQRPKIEAYEDLLFVIMAMPLVIIDKIAIQQVSLFLGSNFVISFHEGEDDPFELLRQRMRKPGNRIQQQGADFLLYCILDLIIDHGFPLLEKYGEEIQDVEDTLLAAAGKPSTLNEIHRVRRELMLLRRSLWPQREVISGLLHGESKLIQAGSFIYLRDCYDHTIQIMDLIENYRDMASSMIDVYLSSVSYRLNEIMRVLTVIATIFMPLSFLASLYGMNFTHPTSPWAMPELHWYYGYPLILGGMILAVVGMLVYFRRRHWL